MCPTKQQECCFFATFGLDNIESAFIISIMPKKQQVQRENADGSQYGPDMRLMGLLRFGPVAKSIFSSLPVAIVTFDRNLKIIDTNPQAAGLIKLEDYIDKSLAQGTNSPDSPGPDWTAHLTNALSTAKTLRFDTVKYALNGRKELLRIVSEPLRDEKTKGIIGGVVVIEDITEKISLQRQLLDMQKLATVGKLASKVAHELNGPMDGILRYVNMTLRIMEQEKLEKPRQYLVQCRQGLIRMVNIVSELLEFSRRSYKLFEQLNIEQVIEDAVKTMKTQAEDSNVRILCSFAPNSPKIKSDNLLQVFCNIIKNAVEAMPNGGELKISTNITQDNQLVVRVRDTGTGFAPQNAEVMFEPFFTTKAKDRGTGLGLAICKDIIERYKGRITAENATDGGSIFSVYLPVTENSYE